MGESAGEARREVERAREQLADTVEAIVYRMNAPRRARTGCSVCFAVGNGDHRHEEAPWVRVMWPGW